MTIINEIKDILTNKNLTISVAESLTSGHLQTQLSSVSGSSNYFEGGITAYSIEQKSKLLNVDYEHAKQVNCVSKQVAKEMAENISRLFNTDIGISTTGYSESYGEIKEPFAHYAIYHNNIIKTGIIRAETDISRVSMQEHVANKVLEELVLYLKTL
ncbi:nicotinamide-nucleotide amidohydrolase family protein [Candidatus Woesearchaeota archaeon]|nr:nicotinamide-nucleotide amidohydrolase family protein [Candidatus Woesearchaeota archaeon]